MPFRLAIMYHQLLYGFGVQTSHVYVKHRDAGQRREGWQQRMHNEEHECPLGVFYNIIPAAFERLCQLRESGFIEVEITGLKGDGGLDGVGITFRSDYGWIGDGHSTDNSFFYGNGGGPFFLYLSTWSQGSIIFWGIRPK